MKNVSIKKMSILGVVLLAASAVTAAILPDKTPFKADDPDDGTLVTGATNNAGKTCVTDEAPEIDNTRSCNKSDAEPTTTTAGQGDSFTGDNQTDQTVNNTSDSAINRLTSNAI